MLTSFIHVQYCYTYLIDQIPVGLLLYSHIPAALIAILFSGYVLMNAKDISSATLFVTCAAFLVWCLLDLVSWFAFLGSANVMFAWSLLDAFGLLMFFCAYYFLYSFITGHDLPLWQKITGVLLILPTLGWTFFGMNLTYYDANACAAIENDMIVRYPYFVEAVFILAALVLSVSQYRKEIERQLKKKILLVSSGVIMFLTFFFSATLLVNILATGDASLYVYNYEIYGLFGMPVLLIYLGYLIVRYKSFDLKVFGAQALVLALVALVGSEFAFVNSLTNQILVAITLILIGAIGILLVRSVKKEIAQREELAVANKGQENLIHVMNHQIKGYLGTARNIFAELSQGDDYGQMPEASKPLLNKGLDEMTAGVEYVQQILKGASAHSGTLPYDMKPIDLKSLVSDLASKQKEDAEKAGLSFESTIADGDYNMSGDAIMLEEAFKNLITNAILYNNPNGSVNVTLSRIDEKILFSVKDTGRGITKEDEKRLYKPGGMGKDSVKINVKASGYGLALVKPVVEKHQGRVWYETEVGKGTTFFVELPITQTAK